jgi:hypothetical protein
VDDLVPGGERQALGGSPSAVYNVKRDILLRWSRRLRQVLSITSSNTRKSRRARQRSGMGTRILMSTTPLTKI